MFPVFINQDLFIITYKNFAEKMNSTMSYNLINMSYFESNQPHQQTKFMMWDENTKMIMVFSRNLSTHINGKPKV